MGKTTISWTDYSWPVVNGCRRVSPGCEHCYAERLTATRLTHLPKYAGLAGMSGPGRQPQWTGASRLWAPDLEMPFKTRTPSKIFVCDMGDLFFEGVPDAWIDQVFAVMAFSPQHTFQVLTKRPKRLLDYFAGLEHRRQRFVHEHLGYFAEILEPLMSTAVLDQAWERTRQWYHGTAPATCIGDATAWPWPLPNVWLGTSVENQATADERIPWLLKTPAALRFVSVEPLLAPLQLEKLGPWHEPGMACPREVYPLAGLMAIPDSDWDVGRIGWAIIGGESGPGFRPMELAWLTDLIDQCRAAHVPVWVKQDAARRPGQQGRIPDEYFLHEFPRDKEVPQ